MERVTTVNAPSNGSRRPWHRTKRGIAAFVSCSVAGAVVGGVLFGAVPYLLVAGAYGFTTGFEAVIHAFVFGMVPGGILGAVSGTLVVVLVSSDAVDDCDDLLSVACLTMAIGVIAGLIASGTGGSANGAFTGVMVMFGSVILGVTMIVGVLVYDD